MLEKALVHNDVFSTPLQSEDKVVSFFIMCIFYLKDYSLFWECVY